MAEEKKKSKKKKFMEIEAGYEVEMYKLIAVAAIVVLVSVVLGVCLGKSIGYSAGVSAVEVKAPEYCTVIKSGATANITCGTELKDATVDELCDALSTSLKKNLKVLLVAS